MIVDQPPLLRYRHQGEIYENCVKAENFVNRYESITLKIV
jgi:hypothetical protein